MKNKKLIIIIAVVVVVILTAGIIVLSALGGSDSADLAQSTSSSRRTRSSSNRTSSTSGGGSSAYEPTLPTFNFSDNRIWVGAEDCYYDGGNYELYQEDGAEGRNILTNLEGATVSFKLNSTVAESVPLVVRLAVNLGGQGKTAWASDKLSLTVNGKYVPLDDSSASGAKWLYQPSGDWWKNANYIDSDLGNIDLKEGENTLSLSINTTVDNLPRGEFQLDCFIIGDLSYFYGQNIWPGFETANHVGGERVTLYGETIGLKNVTGATIKTKIESDRDTQVSLNIKLAVDAGGIGEKAASQLFTLTVNGTVIDLGGLSFSQTTEVWDEKDNYKEVALGRINLIAGRNELVLSVKGNVGLDCYVVYA